MTKKVYHLNLQKDQVKNSKIALLPGDPLRVLKTAEKIRKQIGGNIELSSVLTLCSAMGLKGGCVCGVIVNRTTKEGITGKDLKAGEENAIKVAVASLEYLL